jgi:hypothetical protein
VPRLQPIRLLLTAIAGWIHREQAATIDYFLEENRVLREQLGRRRLRLTEDQRRRLAAKGAALGRRLLDRIATVVTPDTILRWHRRRIATKWTCLANRRVGRPEILKEIRALILRMANDNPNWGYCRIQGEPRKLDHCVARSTIARTLNGRCQGSCRPDAPVHATSLREDACPGLSLKESVDDRSRLLVEIRDTLFAEVKSHGCLPRWQTSVHDAFLVECDLSPAA